MEAAGLVLAVVAVFKDGYLVARFVYNTINSGLKHAEERAEITHNIRQELLFLRSFGSWFMQARGNVTNDPDLNIEWLEQIQAILETLKLDLAEYRDLAEKNDDLYRKYSPSLNRSYESSGVIEFKLEEEVPPVREPTLLGSFGKMFSKTVVKEVYLAGDWALFRRKRLQKLVTRFEKRNEKLRNILLVAIPAQVQSLGNTTNVTTKWLKADHLDHLGLRGHVQIAQIQQSRKFDSADMELKAALVTDDAAASKAIVSGRLITGKARNNLQEEKVLVEFKQYYLDRDTRNSLDDTDNNTTEETRHLDRVTKLAALLHASGSHSLGTLPFRGYINQPDQQRYAFVFNYPEGSSKKLGVQVLHDLIKPSSDSELSKPWPLAQRFHCASKLANILDAFHNSDWVHKSIRSHSVAFLSNFKSKDLALNHPYLINFEYSRLHYNTTYLDRDEDVDKDLYRHPALQVSNRQDSFSCVHDIYALGVVLLEIALWKTAAQMVEENVEIELHRATDVRRLYVKLAKLEVPWLMGDAFLEAILACLTDVYEDDFLIPDRGTFRKRVIENLSPKALHIREGI